MFFKYIRLLFLSLFFSQCDMRTSSQVRFSNNLDIKIPKDAKVIKDEYQDMLQDYVIVYELKLNETQMLDLTKSIRTSKYYNPKVLVLGEVESDTTIPKEEINGVWVKTKFGYIFQMDNIRTIFSAKVDTINNIAEFEESSD